jgi:hypothetical protein
VLCSSRKSEVTSGLLKGPQMSLDLEATEGICPEAATHPVFRVLGTGGL